ncbi:glycoside hydrolase family 3 N-terminal domain-containing protein [Clostridium beijerinckii]|uniref:beta-glucosidase n=1 Tax=Clostridium beijerinckii TaxID=1520 RepID=A0AAE5H3Q1_CLOBE|nr:glycoside hydrolase family 3 N-terminal domain-containing protein [Clostridium beijerinckii]NSB13516.1 beta-glucosidase [Clostridium beijerinckii]OOM23755.1 periplasmic beta-glucosidase precursor [Clostridium beijerinckii]
MKNEEIKTLLSKMTLEEKIGQLTQIRTSYYYNSNTSATGTVSKLKFTKEQKWMIGTVLGKLDAKMMFEIQKEYLDNNRLGIPLLFMHDIIHGFKTIFPIPLALSCSWDEELIEKTARVAAREGSSSGYQATFSPMVDIVRDPRWGRVIESFGEDTLLNSIFGAAMVRGYQNGDLKDPDTLISCVKHFAAYGAAEGGRDYNTVDISECRLRNEYFPPYYESIKSGAKSIMSSFNVLNGIPATANTWLLRKILREEWGYEGVVISDWGAVKELIPHGTAENSIDAAKLSLKAGIDIEMATTAYFEALPELCKDKSMEKLLDEAVERILLLKNECGLFEDPYRGISYEKEKQTLLCSDFRKVAREAASKSAVLLKNSDVLPLERSKNVILIGPYASNSSILGPWSLDGDLNDVITIEQGLINKNIRLEGVETTSFNEISKEKSEEIIEKAKRADVIVLALGEEEEKSGEAGCVSNITLPEAQIKLLRCMKKLNKPLIVLLINGRPLDLTNVIEEADAVLECWFPGTEGGNAIADILYGDYNPSGKLTMSFPRGVGQIPVYYNNLATGRPKELLKNEKRYKSQYLDVPNEPLFPFGYGLGYSKFKYDNLNISKKELSKKERISCSINVTNIGKYTGIETVQLYMRDKVADISRPVKQLIKYKQIIINPNETKTVEFTIDEKDLRYWNGENQYKSDEGMFEFTLGKDSSEGTSFEIRLIN